MAVKTNKLLEQEDALGAFFESLLRDVDAFAEREVADTPLAVQAQPPQARKPVPVVAPVPTPRVVWRHRW